MENIDDVLADIDVIIGELGAARAQRAATDDKIIAEHIDRAYEIASSLRRGLSRKPQGMSDIADESDISPGNYRPRSQD